MSHILKKHHKLMPCYLESLITGYLELLKNLFPSYSFRPKHHFLLHYPNVMRLTVPLTNICSMRYESKHRESKQTSFVSLSRLNISHTIAIKHQLILNNRFLQNTGCYPKFTSGPLYFCILNSLENFSLFSHLFLENEFQIKISVIKFIVLSEYKIEKASILIKPTVKGPTFLKVEFIVLREEDVFILGRKIICKYDDHFDAFKIHSCSDVWGKILFEELKKCISLFEVRVDDGSCYIPKKDFITRFRNKKIVDHYS